MDDAMSTVWARTTQCLRAAEPGSATMEECTSSSQVEGDGLLGGDGHRARTFYARPLGKRLHDVGGGGRWRRVGGGCWGWREG